MTYKPKYNPDVKKSDRPKIDSKNRNMIKKALEEHLSKQPEIYCKPLQRILKKYWKLRAGDYRFVFKVSNNSILLFSIIPIKELYRLIEKRR